MKGKIITNDLVERPKLFVVCALTNEGPVYASAGMVADQICNHFLSSFV
jgi:hypothetical protein